MAEIEFDLQFLSQRNNTSNSLSRSVFEIHWGCSWGTQKKRNHEPHFENVYSKTIDSNIFHCGDFLLEVCVQRSMIPRKHVSSAKYEDFLFPDCLNIRLYVFFYV